MRNPSRQIAWGRKTEGDTHPIHRTPLPLTRALLLNADHAHPFGRFLLLLLDALLLGPPNLIFLWVGSEHMGMRACKAEPWAAS